MTNEQEFHFNFQHLQQSLQHPEYLDLEHEVKTPTADQYETPPSAEGGFACLFGLLLIVGMLFGVPYLISLGWHAGIQ